MFKNKRTVGGVTILDFKFHYKAITIKNIVLVYKQKC